MADSRSQLAISTERLQQAEREILAANQRPSLSAAGAAGRCATSASRHRARNKTQLGVDAQQPGRSPNQRDCARQRRPAPRAPPLLDCLQKIDYADELAYWKRTHQEPRDKPPL